MNQNLRLCSYLVLITALIPLREIWAESTLENNHLKCMARTDCKTYELKAVQIFLGDSSFMRQCVPADAPLPPKFSLFFAIQPDGTMGNTELLPQTEVGKCILKNVAGRHFKGAPQDFVARIDMNFEK